MRLQDADTRIARGHDVVGGEGVTVVEWGDKVSSALPVERLDVRIDAGVAEGDEITRFYDPMISKLIAYGPSRDEAIRSMRRALDEFEVRGLATNIEFLSAIMAHPRFHAADLDTGFIAKEFGDRFIPTQGTYPDVGRLVAVAATMSRMIDLYARSEIGRAHV